MNRFCFLSSAAPLFMQTFNVHVKHIKMFTETSPETEKKSRQKETAKGHTCSLKLDNRRVENVAWWDESSFPRWRSGPIRAWSKQRKSVRSLPFKHRNAPECCCRTPLCRPQPSHVEMAPSCSARHKEEITSNVGPEGNF